MKKLLILFGLLITSVTFSQEINWMTMNEALEAQEKNPKKIFVDVYTTWCGPCKMLDRNTFSNTDVINYINKHYYAVKFNAEGTEEVNYEGKSYTNPRYQANRRGRNAQHQFAGALQVSAYPSMVFFDEKANIITPITGYHTPEMLEIYLKMIASNDYKEVTTTEQWNAYRSKFKGTFKN